MRTTSETIELMDHADKLAKMILQSEIASEYKEAKATLQKDLEVGQIITAFVQLKDRYEEVMRFGKHHPDFRTVRKEIREQKLTLDMNEVIYRYKQAETALQKLLDETSVIVGQAVSDTIKVPTGNPFFDRIGCGGTGSCGSSCGCKVS